MKKITQTFILALIILPLAGLGCAQKAAEKQINRELDGSGEFEFTNSGYEYEDAATGTKVKVGDKIEIPAGFPSDVPIYPKAVARSVSFNPEQGLTGFLILSADDSAEEIMAWYADQAAKNNWTQSGSFNLEDTSMLMFAKGDRNLTVSAAPAEENSDYATLLTLTAVEK